MKKLAFVGNNEPPDKLLELFKKMTPGRSGIWKNLLGVDNYKDADYFAVIDWLPSNLGIDETKCVFLGAHPETMHVYRNMNSYRGIRMYDCAKEFGFGEWWLRYSYDYLSQLKPIKKTKQLGAIMSNASNQFYHKMRLAWLGKFTELDPKDFELYGRIIPYTDSMKKYYKGICGSSNSRAENNNHMIGKEQVYEEHKYMIEFDAPGSNYFSERVFDCLLLWGCPIYWGGQNVHNYLPKDSFKYLDIDMQGKDLFPLIDDYEQRLPAIAKARELLLNKYQIWPRCWDALNEKGLV
jgi:hypothetical protein